MGIIIEISRLPDDEAMVSRLLIYMKAIQKMHELRSVLNYSDIFDAANDDMFEDKKFKINYLFTPIIFLSLVYAGYAVITLKDGSTLTASNLDKVPRMNVVDLYEFKYISIETEMRQQLKYSREYKDVIREYKDLTELVGQESNFDVDAALRLMVAYYDGWQGVESTLIDRIGITDAEITRHLKTDIIQDKFSPILSVGIKDFPNEAGYFMLWELSISDDESTWTVAGKTGDV